MKQGGKIKDPAGACHPAIERGAEINVYKEGFKFSPVSKDKRAQAQKYER